MDSPTFLMTTPAPLLPALGPALHRETFAPRVRRRRRKAVSAARPKPYKGSRAAKRASRPKRKATRRQRWAA